MKNKFYPALVSKWLTMLLASVIALHLPFVYADEVGTLNQSKVIVAKLIDEMLSCDRISDISLAKGVRAEIRRVRGFKELAKMPLKGEAGKTEGWISVYAIRETYEGLEITEMRQSVLPKYKSANLWIVFEASMPLVKEALRKQLGIGFEDSEVLDAMPDRHEGDLFSFHEGMDASIDLDYFSAKPGKIYMSCRRNIQ